MLNDHDRTFTHPNDRLGEYWFHTEDRTYPDLLGLLGERPHIWAECLFADSIADLAVLGSQSTQALASQAEAYEELMAGLPVLLMVKAPRKSCGFVLNFDGKFQQCVVEHHYGSGSLVLQSDQIEAGMSGSPVLLDNGTAIGVVCLGGRGIIKKKKNNKQHEHKIKKKTKHTPAT